ncbi:hypothetical protein ARMGADRAFT_866159, partial [Armillaria gallica]
RKRPRMSASDPESKEWYPWPDKITCTLDILMHLPRSVFSQQQLDLFLWILKENGVDDVPSVKSMKSLNAKLQMLCGIDSIAYKGALGNLYYVNSLSQIIAQEMANPRVRPNLHFYPEQSGQHLSEACQATRWLEEIPDDLASPMARLGGDDYYVFEPAMLYQHKESYCILRRWYTIEGSKQMYAKCWKLIPLLDGSGWTVSKSEFVAREDQFLANFPRFTQEFRAFKVPDPRNIVGIVDETTGEITPWTLTSPSDGNSWRVKARGRRTLSFPIWMYCDDTSGNVSKKWNKHNSFLFTAAGLARRHSHKEYNVHFLCTSNLAAPLEMMDGIVDQIEKAQADGIDAWDCELEEDVLLIPFVLALLGDNPMQSEFACHIGLRGKFFCRACWVMGKNRSSDDDDGLDDGADGDSSGASDTSQRPRRRQKLVETYDQIKMCITAFIKVGRLRSQKETMEMLDSMLDLVKDLGNEGKVKKMRTNNGIKDTYQLVFLDRLFKSYKKFRLKDKKLQALRSCIANLPDQVTSPVWRIRGLDPHQDTLVEILHVILLGFLKYMWCDVVQNQLKGNKIKLELLEKRLSAFDTSTLGIDPLKGHTLVTYCGSLTGRDFRTIAQVTLFVIYDLVGQDCYDTWLSLSKLVPLIWQPEIANIDTYTTLLEHEINIFLVRVAKWTCQWFNKPKFHIFLHLPAHIRRFGPAILFATEAFESFNTVIRAKSVHSNRLSPSRDIALAFGQGNRVRHLLSGGSFTIQAETIHQATRRVARPNVLMLVSRSQSTVTQYLGLSSPSDEQIKRGVLNVFWYAMRVLLFSGTCVNDNLPPRHYSDTQTGQIFPELAVFSPQSRAQGTFRTARKVTLCNGDACKTGDHVIVRNSSRLSVSGPSLVGRVAEVLHEYKSGLFGDFGLQRPDSVLVELMSLGSYAESYAMPSVDPTNQYIAVSLEDVLGVINTPHNCRWNRCGLTGLREVRQEHQGTGEMESMIEHRINPSDRILNLAQMHNAGCVQVFR